MQGLKCKEVEHRLATLLQVYTLLLVCPAARGLFLSASSRIRLKAPKTAHCPVQVQVSLTAANSSMNRSLSLSSYGPYTLLWSSCRFGRWLEFDTLWSSHGWQVDRVLPYGSGGRPRFIFSFSSSVAKELNDLDGPVGVFWGPVWRSAQWTSVSH